MNYMDTNALKEEDEFRTKCCSECFSRDVQVDVTTNSSCTTSDGVTKYETGQTWLEGCQQCECKVDV